jgi:hypothetical protein
MRVSRRKHVQAVDLVVEADLLLDAETLNELIDRLRSIGRAVVDGLKVRHGAQG